MYCIMVVDDEDYIFKVLNWVLVMWFDWEVEIYMDVVIVLWCVCIMVFDVVIIDYWMLDMDGIEMLQELWIMQLDIICILLIGVIDIDILMFVINQVGVF